MKNKHNVFIALILIACSCFATDANLSVMSIEYAIQAVQSDMPYMVLSQETNSLKSGLWIDNTNHTIVIQNGRVLNKVSLAMLNTSTNDVYYWTPWPNNVESQFEINMVDDEGKIVPKTALGKMYGQSFPKVPENLTPQTAAKKYGLSLGRNFPKWDCLYTLEKCDFQKTLPQCFEMEKPGNYKFTLIRRIYVTEQRTNGLFLKPITFSPVTVDVRVEK